MKWKQVYWSTETIAEFMEIIFFGGKMFSSRKTHKAKHSSLFILYTFRLAPPTVTEQTSLFLFFSYVLFLDPSIELLFALLSMSASVTQACTHQWFLTHRSVTHWATLKQLQAVLSLKGECALFFLGLIPECIVVVPFVFLWISFDWTYMLEYKTMILRFP